MQQLWFIDKPITQHVSGTVVSIFRNAKHCMWFWALKVLAGSCALWRGYFSTENTISVHGHTCGFNYWRSLRQALQNIISWLNNHSPPRKSAYRSLAVSCRSGETAAAAAPIKRSVLNQTFKREGFIGAAAPAAPPLHQKMLVRDRP